MGPKDVLNHSLDTAEFIMKSYLGDLSDDDLKLVPVEGMHPIAKQVGHLICSEVMILNMAVPGSAPALPEGFEAAHDIHTLDTDPSVYKSRDEYFRLWSQVRAAVKSAIGKLSDADLSSNRDGQMPEWAPTVGAALNMIGLHPIMHAGQFVAVRRKLNKPVAI